MTADEVSADGMAANRWDAAAYDTSFSFVARHGRGVLELLAARPGERVLDLGCGTGVHAAALAAEGVEVVGVDASSDMLDAARASAPGVAFVLADATRDAPDLGRFDAVFSNAALHWMQPQAAALAFARGCLAPGGRLVAEMGGHGNVGDMLRAFRSGLAACGLDSLDVQDNWFPTIPVQSALLEEAGFEVTLMELFDRPTPLDEGLTAADWCAHFRATTWAAVPEDARPRLRQAIDDAAAPELLGPDGWQADYRRLRFVAIAR